MASASLDLIFCILREVLAFPLGTFPKSKKLMLSCFSP